MGTNASQNFTKKAMAESKSLRKRYMEKRCHMIRVYRESRGNREGDGIWAAGAGSGRDRAGTLPAEGYQKCIEKRVLTFKISPFNIGPNC